MKVLSTEGLTKLIDLIKSSFISNEDTQATVAVDAVETSEVTLATVATTGAYSDLSGTPTVDQTYDGTSANAQSGVAVASAISGKADDTDVVHLAGAETITGVKSYSAMPALIFPDETRGTAPSSASYGGISFLDNNGERMAILEKDHLTNGSISLNLRAANPTTTGTASQATLGVTYPMSGNPYATAPASDVNGSIVTTVNKYKDLLGYFKLGNGMIVQWGYVNGGTATTGNVTFPTAFSSNAGVRVVACSNQANVNISVGGESPTGFTWGKSSSSAYIKWIAVGF